MSGEDAAVRIATDSSRQIQPGNAFKLTLRLAPDDVIVWRWFVDEHDLDFLKEFRVPISVSAEMEQRGSSSGLLSAASPSKERRSYRPIASTVRRLSEHEGRFAAPQAGVLVLLFSNEYSWWTTKTLRYSIHKLSSAQSVQPYEGWKLCSPLKLRTP